MDTDDRDDIAGTAWSGRPFAGGPARRGGETRRGREGAPGRAPIRLACVLAMFAGSAVADTFFWDGGGGDGNWTTPANWAGDVAPEGGADLVFPAGASRRFNTNDFEPETYFGSVTLEAVDYVLGGNAFGVLDGIVAATEATSDIGPRINCDLSLFSNQTIANTGASQLTLAGSITIFSNVQFATSGSPIAVQGAITGPGSIEKTGTGTLRLSGASSFESFTGVYAGEVVVSHASGLGGTDGATVVVPGARLRFDGDPLVVSETVSLAGGELEVGSGSVHLFGDLFLESDPAIAVEAGAELFVQGTVIGASGFAKKGEGELTLWLAANEFTGEASVDDGTLFVDGESGGSSASAEFVVHTGALLDQSWEGESKRVTSLGGTVCGGCLGNGLSTTGGLHLFGGTFKAVLNGPFSDGSHTHVAVDGIVEISNAALEIELGFAPEPLMAFALISRLDGGEVEGMFAGLPNGAVVSAGGYDFEIRYNDGGNNVLLVTIGPSDMLVDGFESGDVSAWSSAAGYVGN